MSFDSDNIADRASTIFSVSRMRDLIPMKKRSACLVGLAIAVGEVIEVDRVTSIVGQRCVLIGDISSDHSISHHKLVITGAHKWNSSCFLL